MMRRVLAVAAGSALVATFAMADANVQEKTQVHFSGFLGGVVNVFGGKAAREGVTSNVFVKGDRKASISENSETIIDLGEEKVYHVDLGRKTYKVETFDEIRKRFEEQKERAEKESQKEEKNAKKEKQEGPEYVVEVDVKNTGQKQTINGYDTREVVTTVTVHEKGKTIEKAGGSVFKADAWIGPRIKELREISDFDRRYAQKLYGQSFAQAEAQMAVLIATNPAFAKAMKAFADKSSSVEGTAIRTILTFEAVTGTEQPQQAQGDDSGGTPTSIGSALGGLMRKAAQKRHSEDAAKDGPQHNTIFESTTEVLKASATATSNDVAIPAGFTQR
jgi:hypothetical protein